MAGKKSRRAHERTAARMQARIARAVGDLNSVDEHTRADALRQLCPCRTQAHWTLERYVVPKLHNPSPLVRYMVNFVLSEELEHEMAGDARAEHPNGRLPDPAAPRRWN